ncbi:MAG: hypothetical protein LAT63_11335 [Marinobacter sp.]|nr:hypothetical protein [Marinobacter sp.]
MIVHAVRVVGVALLMSLITTTVAAAEITERQVLQMAQGQFERMYRMAVNNVTDRLETGEDVKPFAIVTDANDTSRTVRIRQAEAMPADVSLEVIRRSLRALVQKGGIGATTVVYVADNPNKESNAEKILVMEMEHVLGPSLATVTPYTMTSGNPLFGEQVVVEAKRSIFVLENP